MPVYHIALFKTKEGATQVDVDKFLTAAKGMLDQIPCLLSIETGKATGLAAKFGQGFEWGVVATLDKLESLPVYESHPAHRPLYEMNHKAFKEMLLFDFEF